MKSRPVVVITADAPTALVRICGVTMIDRLLRTLQRSGFDQTFVLTRTPEPIKSELDKPAWARTRIRAEARTIAGKSCAFGDLSVLAESTGADCVLFLDADNYFDPRLIQTVLASEKSCALVDSDPE